MARSTSKAFSLEPLQNFGAAITGLDLDAPIAPAVAKDLYAAWLEYGILLFPGVGTTREKHVALSEVFGELEIHPLEWLRDKDDPKLVPFGTPETKGPPFLIDGERRAGYVYWHQDTAFTPNLCKGSMLRMIEVPERGGETIWCDTARAYADLPDSLKSRVATLETLQGQRSRPTRRTWGMPNHTATLLPDENGELPLPELGDLPLVRHPMVVTHPESDRKSLLLSPLTYLRMLDMDDAEGDALFDELVGHALQEKYCYRHRWQPSDMVLWDNRRTMHIALGYPYDMRRYGLRTTLKGPMPAGTYYVQ